MQVLKHTVIAFTLAAGFTATSANRPASAQLVAAAGFEVINIHASARIHGIWMARSGTSEPWSPVTLSSAIGSQTYRSFTVTDQSGCLYDFTVRFDDGAAQTFDKVDVCKKQKMIAS